MKTSLVILYTCLLLILASCSKEFASPKDTNIGVFDELSQFVEENYALFEVKQIDWAMVKARYRPKVSNLIAQDSFLSICQKTVAELKDGKSSISRYAFPKPYDFTIGYDILFKLDVALGYIKRVNNYSIGAKGGNINDTTAYAHFYSFYDFNLYGYRDALNFLDFDKHKKISKSLGGAGGFAASPS